MTKSIVAVVVTHNRLEQLRFTVSRLHSEALDKIVIVDNASIDGTKEFLSSLSEQKFHIVNLPDNLGGAGGFEIGLSEAVERFDADWVVVMDDDAYPRSGSIELFRANSYPPNSMIAAAVFQKNGEIAEMNRPWVNPFASLGRFVRTVTRGRSEYHLCDAEIYGKLPVEIDGASFVGLFISRGAIKRNGLPDGRLFIYGDDVIYTLTAKKTGTKIEFDPTITFEHDCETGSTMGTFKPLWKNYYRFRNQIFVYRLAAGAILAAPIILVYIVRWFLWSLALDAECRRRYLVLLCLAISDAVTRNLDRDHAEIYSIGQIANSKIDKVPNI